MSLFFSGPGQTYAISTFVDPYIRDFGFSRSLISSIYSGATLLSGSLLFFVGRLADRFGLRTVTVAVGVLLALACIGNSYVVGPVTLFFGFLALRYFGQGSLTLLPNTLIPQWFIRKRGQALGIMTVGSYLGIAAIPPFNVWMIESWGWPLAWRVWAIVLLVVFVPAAYFLIRNRPEEIGQLPDDDSSSNSAGTGDERVDEPPVTAVEAEEDWTVSEAQTSRSFWLLLYCIGVPSLVNTGITFHLISIMGERGFEPATAAFVLSLMALAAFPATLVAGYLADRYSDNLLLAAALGYFAFVMIFLLFVQHVITAMVFGLLWGLALGTTGIFGNVIWPNYYGRTHLGSIRGVVMTVTVLASAIGPLPYGLAFDWFGGYKEVILVTALLPVLGAMAAFLAAKPDKEVLPTR